MRRSIIWLDAAGYTRTTMLTGISSLAALQAALANYTNAIPEEAWEGEVLITSGAPGTSAYVSGKDVARLIFTDAAGMLVRVQLVAPFANIFKADRRTVDPARISDIITAAVGTLTTATGGVVTAYVGGVREGDG